MRRPFSIAFLLFLAVAAAQAQHGSARNGYYPSGYSGDTWSGSVIATSDTTREITLVCNGKNGPETFTGVLQSGYKVKQKDGNFLEVNPSMIHTGTHLTVYYMAKSQKVNGQKVKSYEIFQIDTTPN